MCYWVRNNVTGPTLFETSRKQGLMISQILIAIDNFSFVVISGFARHPYQVISKREMKHWELFIELKHKLSR
jgi:hypothetical protein